ncbi:MAG: hypothetical protein KI793_29340 [Rivularia sp. (in: Bacteria)]|nr:hypothetical protein [Rivularia sp. MS3]
MSFRIPKTLAEALRKASSPQPGNTATDIVIRGLVHELGDVQGMEPCIAVQLQMLEEKFEQLSKNIQEQPPASTDSRMEEKLEVLTDRVARIEGVLSALQSGGLGTSNNYRRKNSGNPYNQAGRPPQIQPLDEQTLALRLNVNIPTLKEKLETLNKQEFEEWSKNRDRSNYMWRFNEKDKLYHPVK